MGIVCYCVQFLPLGAMLARYMLSSCVRLSVRHKQVLYRDDWANRAGFGMEASFRIALCYKEI